MLCSQHRSMAAREMSADGRPLQLEKGEPKDRLETGWRRRRRRNEGLAPVRR